VRKNLKMPWGFPGAFLEISCTIDSRMLGQRWGHCREGAMLYLFDDYTLDTQDTQRSLAHKSGQAVREAPGQRDKEGTICD
jgi:hypothetical protein